MAAASGVELVDSAGDAGITLAADADEALDDTVSTDVVEPAVAAEAAGDGKFLPVC